MSEKQRDDYYENNVWSGQQTFAQMRMDILKYVFIRSLKLCNFIFKDNILYLNETTENQIFR